MLVYNIVTDIAKLLDVSFITQPQSEARIIVCEVLQLNLSQYILAKNDIINQADYEKCLAIAKTRLTGRSLAAILGYKYFFEDKFIVNDDVLIPRPETELLVECCLKLEHSAKNVLEIGVGSGAITITLAKHRPNWTFKAIDISDKALATAELNAKNILPYAKNVEFIRQDFFSWETADTFDLIVSNPPYISSAETTALLNDKTISDPRVALDGGADGLDFYRAIFSFAETHLKKNGIIIVEHGANQRQAICDLATLHNYRCECQKDYAGLDRIYRIEKAD